MPLILLLWFAVSWTQYSINGFTFLWFLSFLSCSPHTHCRFLSHPLHVLPHDFTSFAMIVLHLEWHCLQSPAGTFCSSISNSAWLGATPCSCTLHLLTVLYLFVPLDCKLFGAGISAHPLNKYSTSCKVLCKSLTLHKNNNK